MLPLLEAEAKERQRQAGRDKKSNSYQKSLTEKIPQPIKEGESRTQAAKLVGTNERYVSDAKKIKQEAPEVFDMMKRGEANLQRAKSLASTPAGVRQKALDNLTVAKEGESSVLCCEYLTSAAGRYYRRRAPRSASRSAATSV